MSGNTGYGGDYNNSLQADGFESEDDLELAAHLDSDSDGLGQMSDRWNMRLDSC